MYAAAWAYTSPIARAARDLENPPLSPDTLALRARVARRETAYPRGAQPVASPPPRRRKRAGLDPRLAFGAGAAATLGLIVVLRRRRD